MYKLISIFLCLLLSSCASKHTSPDKHISPDKNTSAQDISFVKVKYISKLPAPEDEKLKTNPTTLVYVHLQENCKLDSLVGALKSKPDEFILDTKVGEVLYNSYSTVIPQENKTEIKSFASRFVPKPGKEYEVQVFPYSKPIVTEISENKSKILKSSVPKSKVCTH